MEILPFTEEDPPFPEKTLTVSGKNAHRFRKNSLRFQKNAHRSPLSGQVASVVYEEPERAIWLAKTVT